MTVRVVCFYNDLCNEQTSLHQEDKCGPFCSSWLVRDLHCYQHLWIFLCISCCKVLLQMLNPGGPNGLIAKSCSGLWIVLQDQGHALAHPGLLVKPCLFWRFCGFCFVCCTNGLKTVWKQQPSSPFLLLFSLIVIEKTYVCLQVTTCCCECYRQSIPDSQSPSTITSTASLPWCCNWRAQSSST